MTGSTYLDTLAVALDQFAAAAFFNRQDMTISAISRHESRKRIRRPGEGGRTGGGAWVMAGSCSRPPPY